jgi:hypothetical protein
MTRRLLLLLIAGCSTHGWVESGPGAEKGTQALLRDGIVLDAKLVEGGRHYRILHGLEKEVADVMAATAAATPADVSQEEWPVALTTDLPPVLTTPYPLRILAFVLLGPGNEQSTVRLVRMEPGRYQVWWSDAGAEWPPSPRERRLYFVDDGKPIDAAWDALSRAARSKATSTLPDGRAWRPWLVG